MMSKMNKKREKKRKKRKKERKKKNRFVTLDLSSELHIPRCSCTSVLLYNLVGPRLCTITEMLIILSILNTFVTINS